MMLNHGVAESSTSSQGFRLLGVFYFICSDGRFDTRDGCGVWPQFSALDEAAGGREVLEYLLQPVPIDTFLACTDARVIHVSRLHHKALFRDWFGMSDIKSLLDSQQMRYTLNINVTK